MAKATKRPKKTAEKEKVLTRREVIAREHVDLSTNDLQCRVAYLRAAQEKTQRETERMRAELAAAQRTLRAQTEAADTLQSLIDARR